MVARQRAKRQLHGLIPCYKPKGMVSKDVSRWFEERLGRIKLGHVGTLDPLAEGVLPILFGTATRLQDYLLDQAKTYEFEITFGQATTTMDLDGEVVEQMPYEHITAQALTEVCDDLTGDFYQTPPLYSAVKYQGKPLYEYAREGRSEEVPLASLSRTVQLHQLELLDFDAPRASFRVTCSKGTYVRVLATKISECVDSCGMVSGLIRSEAAGINLEQCWTIDQLESLGDDFGKAMIPVQRIQLDMPKWRVSDATLLSKLRMGQKMQVDMRFFEDGLAGQGSSRTTLRSLDRMLLVDPEGNSFGIGTASIQNTGRIAVVMRRGLS
ncbi:MAG: tRNA pseudouridine(55) synthase TruB [Oligoflexus sp.]